MYETYSKIYKIIKTVHTYTHTCVHTHIHVSNLIHIHTTLLSFLRSNVRVPPVLKDGSEVGADNQTHGE